MVDLKIDNDLVFVGVPRERVLIPKFVDNLNVITGLLGKHGLGAEMFHADGHRVDRNRDNIAKAFLKHPGKPDWLLMLDSDMEHPADAAFRLMAHRVPVVGALYFHRSSDEPLAFREGEIRDDEWGRPTQMWTYMRDEVFDYLERVGMPNRDGSFTISGPANPLLECDAVGTGCLLIHRSVIEAMKPPWFEYRAGARSEDLDFCYRVRRELGLPVYTDLSTICGHYVFSPKGQAQFRLKYRSRGLVGASYTEDRGVKWLTEFAGFDDADSALSNYRQNQLSDLWASAQDAGQSDIEFYRRDDVGRTYLLDLLWWNTSPTFNRFRSALVGIERQNVLVIGSGIGTIAIQMALQGCDVTCVEPNDALRDFTRKRWEQVERSDPYARRGTITLEEGVVYAAPGGVDLCISVDVFEHMELGILRGTMETVGRMVAVGGRMFVHNNWGDQGVYPMHHDHSSEWDDIVTEAGFIKVGDLWLTKIK